RKELLPPSASVPRPSSASAAPTKTPTKAIRSYPPATLSPGQLESRDRDQAQRPNIGRSYGGSAFVPWRPRAREPEFQRQLPRTTTRQLTRTAPSARLDTTLPPKRKVVGNDIRHDMFRPSHDVQPQILSRRAPNCHPYGVHEPSPSSSR
ncbi:unnamed protein product, partial [Ectocarpus fasciculatus]